MDTETMRTRLLALPAAIRAAELELVRCLAETLACRRARDKEEDDARLGIDPRVRLAADREARTRSRSREAQLAFDAAIVQEAIARVERDQLRNELEVLLALQRGTSL